MVQPKSGNVNIRSSRNSKVSNNIVGSLRKGTTAKIVNSTPYWYEVSYGKVAGWVRWDTVKEFVTSGNNKDLSAVGSSVSIDLKTKNGSNLRTQPSTKTSTVLTVIPKNKKIHAYKFYRVSNNEYWYKVSYNGYDGWIIGSNVTKDGNSVSVADNTGVSCIRQLKINAKQGLNIRSQANVTSKRKGTIPFGVTVTSNRSYMNSKYELWYYIPNYRGASGWINAAYIQPMGYVRSSSIDEVANMAIVKVENEALRTSKDQTSETITLKSKNGDSSDMKEYEVYKISKGLNHSALIDKVKIKVPVSETALINSIENGDIVNLELSVQRNDHVINKVGVASSEELNSLLDVLKYEIVTKPDTPVFVDENAKESLGFNLYDNEMVLILDDNIAGETVKVLLENGEIGYIKKSALA